MQNNNITLVFGKKGNGKTTWVRRRIKDSPRVVVLGDFRNDYGDEVDLTIDSLQEFQKLTTADRIWERPLLRVRVSMPSLNVMDYCAAILQHVRQYVLILDELDVYCTARDMPSNLQSLVLGSRNAGISIIGASKRPFMTPRLLTSQADDFVVFHCREKRDVDYIVQWTNAEPLVPFSSLKPGEFLFYNGIAWKRETIVLPPPSSFYLQQQGEKAAPLQVGA